MSAAMMNTTGGTALFHGRRRLRMQNPLHYIGNLFAFWLAILLFTNNVWAGNTPTTLMLMGTPSPAMVGQGVTLSVTVIGVSLAGPPSGSVTFKDGAATLGTVTLSNSAATLNSTFSTAGIHSITATYAGDTNYAASSTVMSITVYGHPTASMLTVTPDPVMAGQPVTLKMTVTGMDPAAPPGGTVTFQDGTTNLGTAALSNGTAILNTPFTTAGIHGITATYAGDGSNAGTSMTTWFTVTAAATSIQLVPSANPVQPGQSVSLTATVTGANPSGTVTFKDGNTLLGTATVTAGSATLSHVFNTVGTYALTASYSGDANNLPGVSSPVTLAVADEPQVYYIHADHLDTPRTITATNGTVVWQWDNTDPFGANVPNENPSGLGQFVFDLRFTGMVADKETNTFYNVNRDYAPARGGYMQFDPIGLRGGINGYAYALNNPLSYVDPYGLWSWRDINPYKVIKALVCNANDVYQKAMEESRVNDDAAWEANNKAIKDAYDSDEAACKLQSADTDNSSNSCPADSKSPFQACMERANADRRRKEDDNWAWYSGSFSRQKTPAENASSTVSSICEIL